MDGGRSFHLHRMSDRSEIRVWSGPTGLGPIDPEIRTRAAGSSSCVGFIENRTIELWDLERGEMPAAWPADVCDAAFRPDGGQVAALRPDGELRVYDLPAMTEAGRCRLGSNFPAGREYTRMALSRDGR